MDFTLRAEDVCADTAYRHKSLPDPCLQCKSESGLEFEYRVYVLECENEDGSLFYYVGFEHRSQIGNRVRQHFAGRGAAYTQERRPRRVLLVWPVRHAAAEAYLFALLLSTLPAGSLERLGGWTQTSVRPSPLCRQQFEEQRRCMRSLCFKCGGRHFAKDCNKPVQGVQYKCPSCNCAILISSRGQSVVAQAKGSPPSEACGTTRTLPAGASTLSQPPLAQMRPATAPPQPRVGAQPRADPPSVQRVERPAKVAKTSAHAGKRVSVCGREYTALSWYLGVANPSKPDCRKVADCVAVELDGGDLRTLVAEGYAVAPPQRPKPVLPGRERLPTSWTDTCICTDKKVIVRVRRQGEVREKSLRQSLFLVSSLDEMEWKS